MAMRSYRAALQNKVPQQQWESARAIIQSRGLPIPTLLSALIRVLDTSPPPPPPPPPMRPSIISVSFNGSISAARFTVTGERFLGNLKGTPTSSVLLRIVDAVALTDRVSFRMGTDGAGKFTFVTPEGDMSGLSVDAFGKARVAFSANDGRIDPGSVPAGEPLWSNTVHIVIP